MYNKNNAMGNFKPKPEHLIYTRNMQSGMTSQSIFTNFAENFSVKAGGGNSVKLCGVVLIFSDVSLVTTSCKAL